MAKTKTLGDRIQEQRKAKGLSQSDLAKAVKVHFSNIGRYERGEAMPAADILSRIAQTLDVSQDFLINGTLHEKASAQIKDQELLSQFHRVEQLSPAKKALVKEFLDAFLFKDHVKGQLA
jgi:transcriptional regulator with XRE-family HTH domain